MPKSKPQANLLTEQFQEVITRTTKIRRAMRIRISGVMISNYLTWLQPIVIQLMVSMEIQLIQTLLWDRNQQMGVAINKRIH